MLIKKNLSMLLPTRNRPKFLFHCLKSFFDLNLHKSQLVVIDEESTLEELVNNEMMTTEQVINKFANNNLVFVKVKSGTSLNEKTSLYLEKSLDFNYFSLMGDDDFFIKNNGIEECIKTLNDNKDVSFALTSSYMFQDSYPKWTRNFNLPDNIFEGKDFLKNFINIEEFQHSTITSIFRIENINKTGAFNALEKILKNNLTEGYGNDTRLYFRNASCGKVACLGRYQTRAIRFHHSSMTFNSPIESSYVYYWNIIENIQYCVENKINIEEFSKYISYWLTNLLTSHIISIFLKANETKIANKIKIENNIDFIPYIKNQFIKYNIDMNQQQKFYYSINLIINKLPIFLFVKKKNEHYIPKNYAQFIKRVIPFYFFKFIIPTRLIKKSLQKLKNIFS